MLPGTDSPHPPERPRHGYSYFPLPAQIPGAQPGFKDPPQGPRGLRGTLTPGLCSRFCEAISSRAQTLLRARGQLGKGCCQGRMRLLRSQGRESSKASVLLSLELACSDLTYFCCSSPRYNSSSSLWPWLLSHSRKLFFKQKTQTSCLLGQRGHF